MNVAELLTLGIALLVGGVSESVARWLGLPGMVGPLVAGILLAGKIDLHPIAPLATLGGALLVFFAGVEEVGQSRMGYQSALRGLVILLVPTALFWLLVPQPRGLEAAIIASLPGVGVLAKLIKEKPGARMEDLLISLAFAEAVGIIVFSGFKGGAAEVALGVLVALVSLKLGEKALKTMLSFDDHAHSPSVVAATFLALLILISFIPELYGFSYVVLALALGIFMSDYLNERPWTKRRLKAISETFLEPLFFLSVGSGGLSLDPYPWLLGGMVIGTKILLSFLFFKDAKKALAGAVKGGADSALLLSSGLRGDLYSAPLVAIVLGALIPSLAFRGRMGSPLRLGELPLDPTYVEPWQKAEEALKVLSKERPAVPVVQGEKPIGWVSAIDLIVNPSATVEEVMEEGIPTFECSTPLWKVISSRWELGAPIIAVVENGKYRGFLNVYKLFEGK
ncbi:hypothetical protein IPA_02055 [Ignicoccus pacificus DSM 13166]|uniref:Uncharacterized protein n=1 Tax=Ignicoccus pacificus DSM 13166 TaxID=940294 RepID=A0A977KBN1_9CREN|nr:hypothetical protein IPA_02055 [Ignicoccus pacificus DSM 13166]